jgi:hypothetical protein
MNALKVCLAAIFAVMLMGAEGGCDDAPATPVSSSGVNKATVKIQTGPDGLTTEQRNVSERLTQDNKPGAIKHLYVISAYSGQVLIYSTVRGKVTSSGKRLTPTTVNGSYGSSNATFWNGIAVAIGGTNYQTNEVLQDDGTYGSSVEYLFWWDTKGVYHQHYIQGGQILHISDQPIAVKNIVINMELTVPDAAP